ncbi:MULTISPECIES: FtsK/SpoIIIE domain-containing protein [unclassified Arthrobacter]|uniref:FtsK/SpoIIIE domain-containing protein n=1 Tax=unclassified Arthrobacter TaxID=235627 RepID=UPI000CE2F5F8|nr:MULTISPECIES: FtsK/SpoIIIE domain-containing protein [unclassified Arthrobacter]
MSATTPFGKTPTQIPSYRDNFYDPQRPRIVSTAGLGISLTTALCSILIIAGRSQTLVVLLAAAGVLGTVALIIATRRHWLKTSARPAAMRQAVAAAVGQPLPERLESQAGKTLVASRYGRGTLTTPGPARRIVLNARFLAMIDPARLETITAILSRLEGIQYTVTAKKGKPGRYIFTPKPKETAVKLTGREAVEDRFTRAAKEVFGASARVAYTWDEKDENYLVSADITGIRGIDVALTGKQNQAGARLLSQLPDKNFKFAAHPSEDRFSLFRSRPLPGIVLPPAGAGQMMADHRAYRQFEVPLGIGPNGTQATWRPARDSHLLIIGGTGGGKTICEHGVIQGLTQAGWRVWLVDGKEIEFLGYKDWRNVEFLAQEVDAQIRLVYLAHETMKERYNLIRAGKIRAEELDPIALVIDEVTSFLAAVDQRYAETKAKGMRAKPPVLEWLGNLGRLARSAKIHLVFGMQRPDTTIIDGELRDNFGARISLGQLKSAAGSYMMWDNYAIGCQVPPIQGRAVSLIDGKPTMIQATYNANPDPNHDDYHPGIIAAMTPPNEVYSRKRIQPPTPTVTDAEEGPEISWTDLLEAKLIDSSGHELILDPVASEESRRFRAQARPGTQTEPRRLQAADSFEEGLALFPAPTPDQSLAYGSTVAAAIARRFPAQKAPQGAAQPQQVKASRQSLIPEPEPELVTVPDDGNTFISTAAELTAGQYATFDQIGTEIMIAETHPAGPGSFLFVGYDDEGQEVTVEVPASATVQTRSGNDDDEA